MHFSILIDNKKILLPIKKRNTYSDVIQNIKNFYDESKNKTINLYYTGKLITNENMRDLLKYNESTIIATYEQIVDVNNTIRNDIDNVSDINNMLHKSTVDINKESKINQIYETKEKNSFIKDSISKRIIFVIMIVIVLFIIKINM